MNILLAIDGSKASQVAVDSTASRPWPPNSSVDVLTVTEPYHLWTTTTVAEQVYRYALELVRAAATDLRSNGLKAEGLAKEGIPKAVILDRAHEIGADLIILGSHGRSALARFALGSVAAAVMRHAHCSVEIVRQGTRIEGGATIRKILLATDGSPCSEGAARSIAGRPWAAATEVRILSAADFVQPVITGWPIDGSVPPDQVDILQANALERSRNAVATATEILGAVSLTVSVADPSPRSHPKEAILDEASRWDADLIVVGSHGRGGVDRFLLGSVSEAVAMHAACSVEIVRQKTD